MSQVREITITQADDLRTLAARELGDPARWTELAILNDLRLPFIVASWRPADRLPHTKIWGDTLLVPGDAGTARAATPATNYGTDIKLPAGLLTANAGGDIAVTSGHDCLAQALGHRIKTPRGELIYHVQYGSHVHLALGLPGGPFASQMAAGWTHEALAEDPRVRRVRAVDAQVTGDVLHIAARVDAVDDNTPVDLNLVLSP